MAVDETLVVPFNIMQSNIRQPLTTNSKMTTELNQHLSDKMSAKTKHYKVDKTRIYSRAVVLHCNGLYKCTSSSAGDSYDAAFKHLRPSLAIMWIISPPSKMCTSNHICTTIA